MQTVTTGIPLEAVRGIGIWGSLAISTDDDQEGSSLIGSATQEEHRDYKWARAGQGYIDDVRLLRCS